MIITSITPELGAEISDIDLRQPLELDVIEAIQAAFNRYHVLVFREQTLTRDQHKVFARHFGPIHIHPSKKQLNTRDDPEIFLIDIKPDAQQSNGETWHADITCEATPPYASMLYLTQLPENGGGDTLFANATAAYQDLSDGMKSTFGEMKGVFTPKMVHGSGGSYDKKEMKKELGPSYGGNEEFAESEVEHPLMRTHGETGNKSIYCSKPHTHRIKGWSHEESHSIFSFLTKHLTQEKYVTQFKWEKGSLAMWDNRCVFHNALNDYPGERRHMHRVTIKGERPI